MLEDNPKLVSERGGLFDRYLRNLAVAYRMHPSAVWLRLEKFPLGPL